MAGPVAECAYVTLLMRNKSYVAGLLVVAKSLRDAGAQADLICMVTPDIPEDCRQVLALYYTKVLEVSYIDRQPEQRQHKFSQRMYDPWIRYSLTKLNALNLVEYRKVLFMDADMQALGNMDEAFEIEAPAGICSSREILRSRPLDLELHGKPLPSSYIEDAVLDSYGIRGCLLLLRPSKERFAELQRVTEELVSFGDIDLVIGPDEWLATKLFQPAGWRHISNAFGQASWFGFTGEGYDLAKTVVPPKMIHYVSEKPWVQSSGAWPDYRQWDLVAADICKEHPYLEDFFVLALRRLSNSDYVDLTAYYEGKRAELAAKGIDLDA